MRKEQSGDANEIERVAMRSVLGALGYLARESRPDLSGPVSILQSRFNRAQVSDIQETNRVVILAKAHTDLAVPVCRIPVDQICLVSGGDASGGGTRAEQAQAGYVIMFADMSLLAGLAAPMTRYPGDLTVSNESSPVPLQRRQWVCLRRLLRVTGVRALWSEMVLGLSLREWREREEVPPLISVTDSKGNYDHSHNETLGPMRTGKVPLI